MSLRREDDQQMETRPPATLSGGADAEGKPCNWPSAHQGVGTGRDVEGEATAGMELSPEDDAVVWESSTDPRNPLNWSRTRKAATIALLSLLTLLPNIATTIFAPSVPRLAQEFDATSPLLLTFVVSVYILGFAIGPLVVAPLSELYGRLVVYHGSVVGFIGLTMAASRAQSIGALCAWRFLQGCFGVTPVTLGGASISDMVALEQRSTATSLWALAPVLGPCVGPIAGGYLGEASGWRWTFYAIAIATGVAAIAGVVVLRETYAPVLLLRKTKRLQAATGNARLRSKLDSGMSTRQHFARAMVRPGKLLIFSPICLLTSLYLACVYGFLYLLFTTFAFVFQDRYTFSPSSAGLVYIGIAIGNLMGIAANALVADRAALHLTRRNGGRRQPEFRLPLAVVGGPFVPIGLMIYGWTAEFRIHWVVPLLGTLLLGVGMMLIFLPLTSYLIDAFTIHAASAIAATTVLRSLVGGLFPLFGLRMYDALGLGWGNSLLAFIAVAISPVPWLFYAYGERLRTHFECQM